MAKAAVCRRLVHDLFTGRIASGRELIALVNPALAERQMSLLNGAGKGKKPYEGQGLTKAQGKTRPR